MAKITSENSLRFRPRRVIGCFLKEQVTASIRPVPASQTHARQARPHRIQIADSPGARAISCSRTPGPTGEPRSTGARTRPGRSRPDLISIGQPAPVSLLQYLKILGNKGGRIGISNANVIAGNPRTGRLMVTLSVALLLLILLSATFIAMRKRTAPQKEPPLPLHPSSFVV